MESEFDKESFRGLGLNKPGTLIELKDGTTHLIGSINTIRGVCDDCPAFDSDAIVTRYAIVFDFQE